MTNQLLISKKEEYIVTAFREDERIRQFQVEPAASDEILGNIYVGKVRNIVKNINAAFVEFQKGQMGYLSLNTDIRPIKTDSVTHAQDRILIGDEILVQVVREAVKTKPPTLSVALDFAGKYVVLTAGSAKVSISHKIKDKQERKRLQELLESYCKDGTFGLLARTNSATASEEELICEIHKLQKKYNDLITYGKHKAQFSCLMQAPKAYLGSIRDMYHNSISEVVTDSSEVYQEVHDFLKENGWENLITPTLWDEEHGKMDAVYDISQNLEKALSSKVWLKSGAYLVIQPTEALISIDVNTGKAISKKKDVQKNFLKVNLEAAKEIAVQIRLRNLSGIILVDFIDMVSSEDNQTLLNVFRTELAKDPIPARLVDMTKLGLVEVTRKKVRKPLHEQIVTRKK